MTRKHLKKKLKAADPRRAARGSRATAPERRRHKDKPKKAEKSSKKSEAPRRRKRHPLPKSVAPPRDVETTLGIGTQVVPPIVPSSEPPPSERPPPPPAEITDQIRALEARLDTLIRRATLPADDEQPPPSISEQVTASARDVVERLASVIPAADPERSAPPDPSNLFTNPYYIRTWGPRSLRSQPDDVDEFGFDPEFYQWVKPLLEFAYRRYFRVETRDIQHVPNDGRAVIVANHSGTVPLDGAMLRVALNLDHAAHRELRWLAEDFVYYLPFVGVWMNRVGAVRACQENAERLLGSDGVVAVFPEGARGIGKLYRDRYRLERFGRGGFVRLCLRTKTPMIPCAIIGAEETHPMLFRIETLARTVGLPYFPITPTFPWLGPLGLVPAPTKWTIRFAEPISVDEYGREAADDHVLVARLSERVQASIDAMLRDGLSRRKSVWFG